MADDETTTFKDADYPKGSIRKLIFHDFLTYNHVEVIPGPSMNVIIGPNGTGKSTIICGICLASGGSPKFLGRSDKMGDFIRHGKVEGYVEMYLKDDDEEDGLKKFKIHIRKPHSAIYSINDHRVTHADHLKAIEAYNIQVGNPCTFLAQDKVKSFAEQNPQLLLKNTEKAGTPELIELHAQLEEKYKDGNVMGDRKGNIQEQIKKLQDAIGIVKPLATNYIESQRRNAHIQAFKAKKQFLIYDAAEKDYREKQKEVETAYEAVKQFNTQKATIEGKISEYKHLQRNLNLDAAGIQHADMRKKVIERIRSLKSTFETDAIAVARRGYLDTKTRHDNWEKDVQNIRDFVAQFRDSLEQLKANPPDKSAVNLKEEEYQRLKNVYTREDMSIESDFRELMTKKRSIEVYKASMANTLRNKMQNLARRENNEGLLRAWDFYTKNQERFQRPVYVPYLFIATEDKYTVYLNNSLGRRDISMFIFGCYEDEQLMQQQNFRINSTILTPEMTAQHCRHHELEPELKRYGFFDYVSNLFTAPDPVKAYFNSVNNVNRLPVGDENTDKNCERIAESIKDQIQVFLTNKTRVQIISSRYGNNVTVGRTPLRSEGSIGAMQTNKIRGMDENTDHLDRKLREVQERRNVLEGRRIELDRVRAELRELQRKYQHDADAIIAAEQKYQKAVRQEEQSTRSKPDLKEAKRALEECERIAKQQTPKEFSLCVKVLTDYQKLTDTFSVNSIEHRRICTLQDIARMEIDEIDTKAYEVNERYKEVKKTEDQFKEAFLNARKELKEITGITHTKLENIRHDDHKEIYNNLLKKFEDYHVPNTIEECEEEIQQEELRAEVGNLRGSKEDVKKLADLEKQEEALLEDLKKNDDIIHNWEGDMNVLLEKWLSPLEALVKKISSNFEKFFSKIDCLGEVRLFKPANKLEIDEYGIEIWVRFRSYNQLRRLTAQQQSGGERSVATMLYLMALQELCPVPFRCVDEINQGMDPTNERLVFNMMAELLSSNTGHLAHTQYFMLTPKLLPGLKFTEKVAVLIIHNSAMMTRGSDILNIPDAPFEINVSS